MVFIGRENEISQLQTLGRTTKATILVVYGRRRVGKTTLIEKVFSDRNLVKIEGVQGEDEQFQIRNFISALRKHFSVPLLEKVKPKTWLESFEILAELIKEGTWTVYLEELQWMANYHPNLVAHLKHVWDNLLIKNPRLLLVLCGSAPSFFETNIIRSQALYNRAMVSINLDQFSIQEARAFLPKQPLRAVFDAYLSVGGIPVYLEKLGEDPSVVKSLCENTFRKDAFFAQEFSKIFVSTYANNPTYRNVIEFVATKGTASRPEILKRLKIDSSGQASKYLMDLELCNFIERVVPLSAKGEVSRLARFKIRDNYLHFYYKFIKPVLSNIAHNVYRKNPMGALDLKSFNSWLGFSFERFCRNSPAIFAEILGFEGIKYRVGPLFNRRSLEASPGYQFDLVYQRADRVWTICEIKYWQRPVDASVVSDFENKLRALRINEKQAIQRVLITGGEVAPSLVTMGYFDRIINLEEIVA